MVNWQMRGTQLESYAFLNNPGSSDWRAAGYGDFNGDGKPDLLLQSQSTGQLVYWILNGTIFVRYGFIAPAGPGSADWRVVSVTDLDGDGKPDIIFQNQITGVLVYWKMNGTSRVSSLTLNDPGSPDWRVVGAGDLNSDGRVDLLLQNRVTGKLVYWLMNRTVFLSFGFLPDTGSVNWQMVAVGDVNGDGKPDMILQNSSTGKLVYWLMNGVAIASFGYLTPDNAGSLDWRVVGIR
jgi:hypothetical protein